MIRCRSIPRTRLPDPKHWQFRSPSLGSRRCFTRETTAPVGPENAQPLVFITSDLSKKEHSLTRDTWQSWTRFLASWGYRSDHIHLESTGMIADLEKELKEALGQSDNPFPAVLFARSTLDCLIAQTYVSSQPLKGLVLVSPPVSNTTARQEGTLKEDLPRFTFEGAFPLSIVEEESRVPLIRKHRLLRDWSKSKFVDLIQVPDGDLAATSTAERILAWLDENGL